MPLERLVMKLLVNGREEHLPKGLTVLELLQKLELNPAHVAVEVNSEVVKKALHSSHLLLENDQVEIVTFVGGG